MVEKLLKQVTAVHSPVITDGRVVVLMFSIQLPGVGQKPSRSKAPRSKPLTPYFKKGQKPSH